ncbi:MAG TPA: hypothetical protein VFX41_00870 [Actinomycetales bacterium]|jgi:hypothetical protein|nr:hypothetical protein [Actinomycetales bacterium]
MEKFDTAVSAYGISLRTPVLSAVAAFPASAWSTARERAVVTAGISARRGGELCPQVGTHVIDGFDGFAGTNKADVRSAAPEAPLPGTTVFSGPPV